jgi:AcrR family transcriptional regulator
VDEGYGKLTTRRVAERAGVSQGILMHYFPTRTQFLAEAIRHVAERIVHEIVDQVDLRELAEPQRREALLDQAWRIHTGPFFQAAMELWSAARTDPDLRDSLRGLERDIARMIAGAATDLLPEEAGEPWFLPLVDAGLSILRGLAMLLPVTDPDVLERRWLTTKRLMLDVLAMREAAGGLTPYPVSRTRAPGV